MHEGLARMLGVGGGGSIQDRACLSLGGADGPLPRNLQCGAGAPRPQRRPQHDSPVQGGPAQRDEKGGGGGGNRERERARAEPVTACTPGESVHCTTGARGMIDRCLTSS